MKLHIKLNYKINYRKMEYGNFSKSVFLETELHQKSFGKQYRTSNKFGKCSTNILLLEIYNVY